MARPTDEQIQQHIKSLLESSYKLLCAPDCGPQGRQEGLLMLHTVNVLYWVLGKDVSATPLFPPYYTVAVGRRPDTNPYSGEN